MDPADRDTRTPPHVAYVGDWSTDERLLYRSDSYRFHAISVAACRQDWCIAGSYAGEQILEPAESASWVGRVVEEFGCGAIIVGRGFGNSAQRYRSTFSVPVLSLDEMIIPSNKSDEELFEGIQESVIAAISDTAR